MLQEQLTPAALACIAGQHSNVSQDIAPYKYVSYS